MALWNLGGAVAALARVRRTSIRTAAGSVLAGVSAVGVVIGVTMMMGSAALASPTPTPSFIAKNIPPGPHRVRAGRPDRHFAIWWPD